MSTTAKKPAASRDTTSTPSASPSRRPAGASTPSAAGAAGANGVARTRSVRSNTPVAARQAAHQRRESLFNPNVGKDSATADADEAARAETVALLDDLKERLGKAETASEQYQRQAEVLQSKFDEASKEQARLEERVHEHEEQVETLKNEKREAARQIQQMESIYEAERSAMVKEKEEMGNREEEMQTVIQRLKDSLAQRNGDDELRPSRHSNNNSPSVDNGSFAPPSSLNRSDSRNNSKLLLQKDKLIESLRLELAEAQIKLVESENQGGGRLHEVERLLMEARMANARLMEDNESYQLLLQEKTLKGDFGASDFGFGPSAAAPNSNQDALAALEGRGGSDSGATEGGAGNLSSLADELNDAAEVDSENYRRLEVELKSAKDQNKALTLYINKIIERLLQHQEFEHILDQSDDGPAGSGKGANTNKDLPPPPQGAAQSLLQRAKTLAIGATGAPAPPAKQPRPRPMSFMPSAQSAHSNPDTAPSIPIGLGRSTSVRRAGGRPMSEQFTGAGGATPGAANIVNAMYKGADGPGGPLSPTLRSAQQFFANGPSATPSGQRTPSAVTQASGASGNFPGMRSETSSTSGESGEGGERSPPSASPPRKEKDRAAFTGGKPRPLRLVQENGGAAAENKRASWFGWAMGKKEGEVGETIKE